MKLHHAFRSGQRISRFVMFRDKVDPIRQVLFAVSGCNTADANVSLPVVSDATGPLVKDRPPYVRDFPVGDTAPARTRVTRAHTLGPRRRVVCCADVVSILLSGRHIGGKLSCSEKTIVETMAESGQPGAHKFLNASMPMPLKSVLAFSCGAHLSPLSGNRR